MKTLTVRELNRQTASILDQVERGVSFEVCRNGRTIGYLTQIPPPPQKPKPDWKAHFEWLEKQNWKGGLVEELEEDRRRLRRREEDMGGRR